MIIYVCDIFPISIGKTIYIIVIINKLPRQSKFYSFDLSKLVSQLDFPRDFLFAAFMAFGDSLYIIWR